jgi:hypothetical protein
MTDPNPWLEQLFNFGSAACEGVLQARAARREARRAAQAESAVPPRWRARPDPPKAAQADNPAAPPTSSPPPASSEPQESPTVPVVPYPVFARPVSPWEQARRANAMRPPRTRVGTPGPSPSAPSESSAAESSPGLMQAEKPAVDPRPLPDEPPSSTTTATPPTATQVNSRACMAPDMEEPAATAGSAVPQLELDFSPRPVAPDRELSPEAASAEAPADGPPPDEARKISALAQLCATVLGDIIGDCVNETLEAVLDRQEARLAELLESQERQHAAEMARLAEANAENLRSILREVLSERPSLPTPQTAEAPHAVPTAATEAVAELQETLRVGLGNVRAGLNQHHNELMAIVRSELRPLAQAALAWFTSSSPSATTAAKSPEPSATAPAHEPESARPDTTPPAPTACVPPGRGSSGDSTAPTTSSRSPPLERNGALTAAQRAHVHLSICDEGDEHGDNTDPPDDRDIERPPRRHHPDERHSSHSEASP